MTDKKDNSAEIAALIQAIQSLAKEKQDLEQKIADEALIKSAKSKARSKVNRSKDDGNINARAKYIVRQAHWNATHPNFVPKKMKPPAENEKHQFGVGHLDERKILCDCCSIWRYERQVVYTKPDAFSTPKWICRDVAKKYGWSEYTITGNGTHYTPDRRTTPVPAYVRATEPDITSTYTVKLTTDTFVFLHKKLRKGTTHDVVRDTRGYVLRNLLLKNGVTIDLVIKDNQIEIMKK